MLSAKKSHYSKQVQTPQEQPSESYDPANSEYTSLVLQIPFEKVFRYPLTHSKTTCRRDCSIRGLKQYKPQAWIIKSFFGRDKDFGCQETWGRPRSNPMPRGQGEDDQERTTYLVGGWATHLNKNILVKLDSISPRFGVKPPPSYTVQSEKKGSSDSKSYPLYNSEMFI